MSASISAARVSGSDSVKHMHMHWAADPAQALAMAAEWFGSAFSIALIPDGVGVVASNTSMLSSR
ncbi:hypothetical protein AGMMS49992_19610 [Clostridia bacterium]|nr:hypothetical protein AGMMS49992_19610 [Clostridia bacterium]